MATIINVSMRSTSFLYGLISLYWYGSFPSSNAIHARCTNGQNHLLIRTSRSANTQSKIPKIRVLGERRRFRRRGPWPKGESSLVNSQTDILSRIPSGRLGILTGVVC
jgi:hypothetical protein